jgi:hypothetical protein
VSDDRRPEIQGLIEKVRDVLVSDWDPIGVGDNPNLREEYDAALSPVLGALAMAPSEGDLTALLVGLEERFGVRGENPGRARAVTKLLALRESIAHWPNG